MEWMGIFVFALLIVVLISISFNREGKKDLAKTSSSIVVEAQSIRSIQSQSAPAKAHTLNCASLIKEYNRFQFRTDHRISSNDWLELKLRLNHNETGVFPFPKVYTSDPNALETSLSLAPKFRIKVTENENGSSHSNPSVQAILNRYCVSTLQRSSETALLSSTAIHSVHAINIEFVDQHLLLFNAEQDKASSIDQHSSSTMKKILQHRSEDNQANARYIDAEMYTLTISTNGIVNIKVHGLDMVAGIHRGVANAFATLDQLLHQVIPLNLPLSIVDWPDNHWRGISQDVSRHFIPVPQLKQQIKAMAAVKYDTLHLHITDAQSFPLLLDDVGDLHLSELALRGAFDRSKIYTKKDMRELVDFAHGFGMEIVPEIDMPAHALSWGSAFEDLIVRCKTVAGTTQTPHNIYPLDPSNPKTYRVLKEVLRQVSEVFPSKYLHIGGDEVDQRCWSESPSLMNWAKENNLTVQGITGYFEQQVVDATYALNKIPVLWQGVLDSKSMPPIPVRRNNTAQPSRPNRKLFPTENNKTLNKTHNHDEKPSQEYAEPAIVQPWKCWGGLALRSAIAALHSGHPVVMSACWYLDYNQEWSSYIATDLTATARATVALSNQRQVQRQTRRTSAEAKNALNGSDVVDGSARENVTERDAVLAMLTPTQRMYLLHTSLDDSDGVLSDDVPPSPTSPASPAMHSNYFIPGGEASMWLEKVDCANLECRLWPRAGAVAARLWGLGDTFESVSYYGAEPASLLSQHNNARHHPGAIRSPTRSNSRHRAQPSTQTMHLSLVQTKQLFAAYIQHRYYLENILGLTPAGVVMHYPLRCPDLHNRNKATMRHRKLQSSTINSKNIFSHNATPHTVQETAMCHTTAKYKSENMMYSEQMEHELQAYSRIHEHLHVGVTLSSNSNNNNHIPDGGLRLTAQCLGIPEEVQRPLSVSSVSAVQLNVGDGSTGLRGQKMLSWLQEQANKGVLFVGFCELNGWQDLESWTDSTKNHPKISFRAANAGFSYSHIMVNSQPYNIGIVSARPFTVLGEFGPPTFQRGVLHVYFANVALHVFVVHLHAHSSSQRILEATSIVKMIDPLLSSGQNVAVMGDFNTLSIYDRRQHIDSKLPEMLLRTDQPELFSRLRKKYLIEDNPADGIQYKPMDIFLNAGLEDACVVSCQQITEQTGIDEVNKPTWSLDSQDEFSKCMQHSCAATEPTLFNPEWPLQNDSHPFIRLDFILLSQSIVRQAQASAQNRSTMMDKKKSNDDIERTMRRFRSLSNVPGVNVVAGVDKSNMTDVISDHYPVYASWAVGDLAGVPLY